MVSEQVESAGDGLVSVLRSTAFVALARAVQTVGGSRRLVTRGVRPDRFSLTFDDGPDPIGTARVMDALAACNARATFFCLGQHAEHHPRLLRDLRDAGHEIGSHTYSHTSLLKLDTPRAAEEVRHGREMIEDVLGQACPLFRPPHGLIKPQQLPRIWDAGNTVVLWNFSTRDYSDQHVSTLSKRIAIRGVRARDIVLLHDTSASAPKLATDFCRLGTERGLSSATISEMV